VRLVIISNMAHYRRADGTIVGHGATARELDALATLFDDVRHVACLHDEPAPGDALPYAAANLALVAVPPAGGDDLAAKLGILRHTPRYLQTIARELAGADAVHVRAPANISLYAIAMLTARRTPRRRWIKYAGNWQPHGLEPASYRLQRAWLARPLHRAQVTINGRYADQPAHVHSFDNPCLTDDELALGRAAAATKQMTAPIRLLFVGHLGPAKNPRVAIDALGELRGGGADAQLDIAGDGADLPSLRAHAAASGLAAAVTFRGAVPRPALAPLYAAAHFVVLPSRTEGWPKVLGEGMAAGAVPIATAVGSIPDVLGRLATGTVVTSPTAPFFAAAIQTYLADPARWRRESEAAATAAERFSYGHYLRSVAGLLDL
jgi:glycosyltransferase involved in cell wall biosynthesis